MPACLHAGRAAARAAARIARVGCMLHAAAPGAHLTAHVRRGHAATQRRWADGRVAVRTSDNTHTRLARALAGGATLAERQARVPA